MASRSLRRYDVQARASLIVSILSVLAMASLALLLLRNYDFDLHAVIYAKKSYYSPMFFAGTSATMLLSAIGLVLGFNSAGQRRNDVQTRSWIAYFLSVAVLSGSIVCFCIFWFCQMKL